MGGSKIGLSRKNLAIDIEANSRKPFFGGEDNMSREGKVGKHARNTDTETTQETVYLKLRLRLITTGKKNSFSDLTRGETSRRRRKR